MKFKISAFSDEAGASLDAQIAALHENNVKYMEPRGINGKNISAMTEAELTALASRLRSECIGVSAIGSPIGKIGIHEDFAPHLEAFSTVLRAAELLGTNKVRVFSFYLPDGARPADYRDEVMSRMKTLVDLAAKKGIYCCHENEHGIYGERAKECADLLWSVDDLGCVFDPANFVLDGQDVSEAAELLLNRTDYMHIKDACASDRTIVPAGYGDGRFIELLERLSKREGEMFLTVEPHLKVFDGLGGLQKDGIRNKYEYENQRKSFAAAVTSLKILLGNGGYHYE